MHLSPTSKLGYLSFKTYLSKSGMETDKIPRCGHGYNQC